MSWGQPAQPAQSTVSTQERDNLIVTWRRSVDELKTVKEREMSQRTTLASVLFPTPKKGTQRYDLGSGYAVKLVYKLNFTLGDKEKTDGKGDKVPVNLQVEDVMDAIEKLGNEGAFLVDRLIRTKYELSESEYNKLDMTNPTHKSVKALIDKILVVTPASPSLELEEPKTN